MLMLGNETRNMGIMGECMQYKGKKWLGCEDEKETFPGPFVSVNNFFTLSRYLQATWSWNFCLSSKWKTNGYFFSRDTNTIVMVCSMKY